MCKSLEYCEQYREGSDWVRGPLLGRGAFSSCYQAWDITSGTIMAVKQVSNIIVIRMFSGYSFSNWGSTLIRYHFAETLWKSKTE